MTAEVGDLVLLLLVAAVAGTGGAAIGILILAPRLTRHAERSDEDPGARPD